jgi:hypothetical protein
VAALASLGVGLSATTAPADAAVSTAGVLSQAAGPPMIVVPAGPAPSLQLPARAVPTFHPTRPAHVRLASTERPREHAARRPAPAAHAATGHATAHQSSAGHHRAAHQAGAAHRARAAHAGTRHAWTGHAAGHSAAARHPAPSRPARPYLIYDSVTPSAIPAHHEIATYATGGYAVAPSQVAGRKVLWIDTNGSDPRASALDVEPGDATPSMAATWAWRKLHSDPHGIAIIYTMQSEWRAAQAAVGHLPARMRSHVRWWIADPTGYPHIVPGANATQWYWGSNFDITTAKPNF